MPSNSRHHGAALSLLFHYALERILRLAREFLDSVHFGFGDFERIHSRHAHPILMHPQHYFGRFGVRLMKNGFEQFDDELHWSVIIIEQDDLEHRRTLGFRLRLGAPLDDGSIGAAVATVLVAVCAFGSNRETPDFIRSHSGKSP